MASKYDLSEFAPQDKRYDLSEFAPAPQGKKPLSFFEKEREKMARGEMYDLLKPPTRENIQMGLEIGLTPEIKGPAWLAEKIGSKLANYFTSIASGAGIGALSSKDKATGAELGAAIPFVLSPALGAAKGAANLFSKSGIGDTALKMLRKGNNLSPEETASNLENYYKTSQGEQLPVDIGTAANNPTLKGLYSALTKVPFSGAAKKSNIVEKGLAQNEIEKANKAVQGLESKSMINVDQANGLRSKLTQLQEAKSKSDLMVNEAPNFLNRLNPGSQGASQASQAFKDWLKKTERTNMRISNENYRPINESKIRLDKIASPGDFKNYAKAAHEIDIQRDTLQNLFGIEKDVDESSSREAGKGILQKIFGKQNDLGRNVKAETGNALNFFRSGKDFAMELPDVLERTKKLSSLAAAAKEEGKLREASLLTQLSSGLKQDINDILEKNGHGDIAKALSDANKYHEENVVPFRQNREIRKTVYNKQYLPDAYKVSKTLHDPNFQKILLQLPDDAKSASLFQLLTKGKYSSKGVANMSPKEISNAFQQLEGAEREGIEQYHPLANDYFENLGGFHDQNRQINDEIKGLSRQLGQLNKPNELKALPQAREKLDKAVQKSYGIQQTSPDAKSKMMDVLKAALAVGGGGAAAMFHPAGAIGSLLGGGLVSKQLSEALTNPELLKAYVSGGKLSSPNEVKNLNKILAGILAIKNPAGKP